MKSIIVIFIFGLINCNALNHCCDPEQGVLEDDENYCVNLVTNVTSPTTLKCKDVLHLTGIEVTPDNKLILSLENGNDEEVDIVKYCIQNSSRTVDEPVAVICSDDENVQDQIVEDSVYGYCMIVSSIFLVLIVFVYSVLPKMRDLQGKSIINFCISLAIGLFILGIMKITEYSNLDLCATRSFFMYFFLLASFFWTNAITIQIFSTLGRPTISDYSWRPFLWYALYAWGCPAFLTIILAIINYTPGNHQKPGIGLSSCWFFDNYQQWYYMYSVMSILIAVNICIFVYILVRLWRGVSFSSKHVKAVKYKFWMTFKMCIIMGLPWIFEMISSLTEAHIIWVILDFFNLLQGLLLFLILVVFRRRVIKELYSRGWLQCVARCVERHLAVGDDEEDVVEHTIGVALDDKL